MRLRPIRFPMPMQPAVAVPPPELFAHGGSSGCDNEEVVLRARGQNDDDQRRPTPQIQHSKTNMTDAQDILDAVEMISEGPEELPAKENKRTRPCISERFDTMTAL